MPSQKEPPKKVPLKLSYAYAPEDRLLCEELNKHLLPLMKQGVIASWSSYEIVPGVDWEQVGEIYLNLNSADIILLLVSSDFIASDFCYSSEMRRALERHKQGKALVIPIILRPVEWESTPLGQLQALPANGHPIVLWQHQDEVWRLVVQSIQLMLSNVRPQTKEQWILEGKEHYDAHQYSHALAAYKMALDLDPADELVRETVGRILIQLERYDEALTIYDDLLHTSSSASAYLFKGLVLQRLGRSVEALAAYQKAREYGYAG